MVKNKKKRKLKTPVILTILVIIVLGILVFSVKDLFDSLTNKGQKKVEVLDTIKGYDYKLDENDSKYFKELFNRLKKTLTEKNVNEKEYAKLVSQLFITDFYSLGHAINKNDVGGTQFIYKDYRETFETYAKDTVYRYVENNIYGNRKQTLPDITKVEVTEVEQGSFETDIAQDDKAYNVTLKLTYEKDLDYPTTCNLTLIHSNDKLEIAAMNYEDEEE